jgi:uncharacterized protein YutE (UPF0331/DUF86 family)
VADDRVVATQLERIEQYHGEPREKQQSLPRTDLLTETTEQRAVERMFENAIQACTDLAKHIVSTDFGFDGDTSKEAVRILRREGDHRRGDGGHTRRSRRLSERPCSRVRRCR